MISIRTFTLAVLLAGSSAMPAFADPSGFLSLGAGIIGFDDKIADISSTGSAIEAAASGVYQFSPELSAQGDLVLRRYDVTVEDVDNTTTQADAALHLFFRNDSYLIGGFAQGGRTRVEYGNFFTIEQNRALAGLEGQFYADDLTFYGRVAIGHSDVAGQDESDATYWVADAELRYFITDNFRVDLHGGIETFSPKYFGDDVTSLKIGIGTEYRLDDSPVSLFGSLDFVNTTGDKYLDQDEFRLLVGAKFDFGTESLKARDRTGVTLKPVESTVYFQVPR